MSKVLSLLLILVAAFSLALAQEPAPKDENNPPSKGVAPKGPNGVGRADVRVFDEQGNPIKDAYVKLESSRSDGFFCESWDNTDAHGITVLPPIHMGTLKFKIKAKGYKPMELEVPAENLGEPVHVTLVKK